MKWRYVCCVFMLTAALAVSESELIAAVASPTCDSNIHELNRQQQCQLIRDCDDLVLGRINFLKMYFCGMRVPALVFLVVSLLVSFFGLGLTASEYLTPNLHFISKFLNLSDNLAGLTLVAMGNSSPDILSNYKAMNLGHGDLALSELIGACFFITSIVVGTMSILHPFKIPRRLFIRDVICFLLVSLITLFTVVIGRLNIVICLTLIACYLAYVSYVVVSYSISKEKSLQRMRENTIRSNFVSSVRTNDEEDDDFLQTTNTLPTIEDLNLSTPYDDEYHQELSDELDQFRLTIGDDVDLSNTYAVKQLINELNHQKKFSIQLNNERSLGITMTESEHSDDAFVDSEFQDTDKFKILELDSAPSDPIGRIVFFITLPMRVLVKLTVPVSTIGDDQTRDVNLIETGSMMLFININFLTSIKHFFLLNVPLTLMSVALLVKFNYKIIYSAFGFISSVLWISTFATEIINILKTFSIIYQISDVILGFTVFALGNCIGDFIANYTIAKLGMPIMAFGACFGSPILALTFMGLNGLVILLDDGDKPFVDSTGYIIGHSASIVILNLGLISNLVLIYVLARRYDWHMNEKVGYALIGNWVFVNFVCILIELV